MFKTQFLVDQDDYSKTINQLNTFELSSKRIDYEVRKKTFLDIFHKTVWGVNLFYFSKGGVELKQTNQLYCLEHIPHNTDLILPKNPNLHDWIVLFYEQTTIALDVSFDRLTKIKIRGNGKRIMGFDEPLICDMPFISLRLTFMGDIDGWVVS